MEKNRVTVRIGCQLAHKTKYHLTGFTEKTQYRYSHKSFLIPDNGTRKETIKCPTCDTELKIKVFSLRRARTREAMISLVCFILTPVFIYSAMKIHEIGYLIALIFFGCGIWESFKVITSRLEDEDFITIGNWKHKLITDSDISLYGGK